MENLKCLEKEFLKVLQKGQKLRQEEKLLLEQLAVVRVGLLLGRLIDLHEELSEEGLIK